MWYFIGLGNPNEEYKTTRHNVGMNAVAFFFEKEGCAWREKDSFFESDVMKISKGGSDIVGLLPTTFMNASGRVARAIVKRGGGAMNIVVVHDDLDLPFGEVRISFNRGSGGHNGVSSINEELGTPEYLRVRIGIAHVDESGIIRKPDGHDAVDHYVLGNFNPKETELLTTSVYPRVVTVLSTILEKGYISAMNEYN